MFRIGDCIVIVFFLANPYTKQNMTFKNKFIGFGMLGLLVVVGIGLTYFEKNKSNEEKNTFESLETYTWYTTEEKGFISNENFPQLKPAPEGYLWYVSDEYSLAFLYPNEASVNFCSDSLFCEKFGSISGGIIINTTPSSEIVSGEKTGWDSVKRDLYGLDIEVAPYSEDTHATVEQTEADVRNVYYDYYKVDPIIFTEQNRGTYDADYTKPLLPVYFINKNGAYSIGFFANDMSKDKDEKFCINELQANCVMSTQSYEDYMKIREYINTVIQSFTVIE